MNVDAGNPEQDSKVNVATGSGEWITPPVSYVAPSRRFCALCGRPIARRYWRVETEGVEYVYCDPAHATLYATYPKKPN